MQRKYRTLYALPSLEPPFQTYGSIGKNWYHCVDSIQPLKMVGSRYMWEPPWNIIEISTSYTERDDSIQDSSRTPPRRLINLGVWTPKEAC